MVVADLFEVAHEPEHALEGEVDERQLGDPTMRVVRDEPQEQPDAVAVALHRRRSQSFHREQTVDEARLDDGPQGLGRHGDTALSAGAAKPSKRRFAAASSSDVIVR